MIRDHCRLRDWIIVFIEHGKTPYPSKEAKQNICKPDNLEAIKQISELAGDQWIFTKSQYHAGRSEALNEVWQVSCPSLRALKIGPQF